MKNIIEYHCQINILIIISLRIIVIQFLLCLFNILIIIVFKIFIISIFYQYLNYFNENKILNKNIGEIEF